MMFDAEIVHVIAAQQIVFFQFMQLIINWKAIVVCLNFIC